LYVNDILLAGNNMGMIQTTKKYLSFIFEMKDMGEARYVLGVEVSKNCSKKFLGLHQEAYINKTLEHFWMHYSKPMDTLVEKGPTLSLDKCLKIGKEKERMNDPPYASVIGSLMYVMLCIRPDICIRPAHWQISRESFITYVVQVTWSVAIKMGIFVKRLF